MPHFATASACPPSPCDSSTQLMRILAKSPSRPRRRRWLRLLGIAALVGFALTWLPVLILRFLPPPTSAFMVERRLAALGSGESGFTLKQRFVPLADMSPELPIALVAAEDQKFPLHHGFDLQAIGDAMDDADERHRCSQCEGEQCAHESQSPVA